MYPPVPNLNGEGTKAWASIDDALKSAALKNLKAAHKAVVEARRHLIAQQHQAIYAGLSDSMIALYDA